jgi:hypothetical protein
MLENGLYDLRYRAGDGGAGHCGKGLAMLRDGRIMGCDPWGGAFTGRLELDPQAGAGTVRLRFEVPPGGELITGFAAGPDGAAIDIVGTIAPAPEGAAASTVVEVAGAEVGVSFNYLGPLPEPAGSVPPATRVPALRRRIAARMRR